MQGHTLVADFNDVGVKGVITEGATAVVAIINTASLRWNQRFYFYFIMHSVVPSLSKEVNQAAEGTHAEMGGGKDLAEDHSYIVVIAGIGLVEVSGHSSSE